MFKQTFIRKPFRQTKHFLCAFKQTNNNPHTSSQVIQVVYKKYRYTSPLNAYTHLKASFYKVLDDLRLVRTPNITNRGFRHITP